MRRLKDRVAVVTGAASGIGRATAVALSQKGCHLALCDVDEQGLVETERLCAESGVRITRHVVDVACKERMMALACEVSQAHGRVNLLVNNAGVNLHASLRHGSLEDIEWLIGVNFWGVVYGCLFFLPLLEQAGEGHIVNVSSVFGLVGVPMQSAYCASKFAVRGWTESLRMELAGTGISVTGVYPGGVATNIARSSRCCNADGAGAPRATVARALERMLAPEAAARAIVRGIERDQKRVLVTGWSRVADVVTRAFPDLSVEVVGRTWRQWMP